MNADLAMINDAPLALMHKLYRVFDSDNVIFALTVGHIDNRRQGCGFSAAGGAGDQDQPPWQGCQF